MSVAKLSVSVPDDLWAEARTLAEKDQRSSRLIQEALRQWVLQRRRGALAGSEFEPDRDRLREVASVLGAAYEKEFRRGYEAALDMVESAGDEVVSAFDIVAGFVRHRDWWLVWDMATDDGRGGRRASAPFFWEEIGTRSGEPPNDVFADGAEQALLDLWDMLREGSWRDTDRSSDIDDD